MKPTPQSPRTRNAAMVRASIKAKARWSYPSDDCEVVTDVPPVAADVKSGWCSPVYLLPRSREAQEVMLNQAAKAVGKRYAGFHPDSKEEFMEIARACLAAVGIVEPEARQ